ncbi:MAG: DUF3810 domain-containing protein [Vicinamibacteria bacterium]
MATEARRVTFWPDWPIWLARLSAFALLPISLLVLELGFRYPEQTERFYGEGLYPVVATALGRLNGLVPFSVAQILIVLASIAGVLGLTFRRRGPRHRPRLATAIKAVTFLWIAIGVLAVWFVVSWGLNYARPGLEERLALSTSEIRVEEVLDAGKRSARRATELHDALAQPVDRPTRLTVSFTDLNDVIDRRLGDLRLPGDRLEAPTSPAKKLWGSTLLSYLGLSGIFVPFTGEPSINALVPDASLPIVVAHERAHQRGITDEGEANLVAFMTCAGAADETYVTYAAYLYASAHLLGAASRQAPEEARAAWEELGPGPRHDLEAIREFWSRYRGTLSVAASRVNDVYLRSVRVPGGTRSYQRIVELLVALDRRGDL